MDYRCYARFQRMPCRHVPQRNTSPFQVCTVLKFPWAPNLACRLGALCCLPTLGAFQNPTRQVSTSIRTLHISPRNQVVLNTWTLEAECVDLSLTFSRHMARNPDVQTPQCVAIPPHDVNFDWAPCVCAAKPCCPCIDLTRLTVKAKSKDEYVTKRLEKQPQIWHNPPAF